MLGAVGTIPDGSGRPWLSRRAWVGPLESSARRTRLLQSRPGPLRSHPRFQLCFLENWGFCLLVQRRRSCVFDPGLPPRWGHSEPACDTAQLLFTLKQLVESFPGEGSCTYKLFLVAVGAFP